MRHFQSLAEVEIKNAWVTIGAFDGVHRGHQAILAPLVAQAHAAGCPAVVITFFPHPAMVLRDLKEAHNLSTPAERANLLGALGVDVVITLTFDQQLAALSASDFMQALKTHLGLRQLWIGYDFALGRNRQGDIPTLRRLGEALGYSVHVIPEVKQQGGVVSSSQIRRLLRAGQASEAARLLGHLYQVSGTVVHGEARGRTLGIPTANLLPWPHKIIPASGVYATWAWLPPVPAQTNPNGGSDRSLVQLESAGMAEGEARREPDWSRVPAGQNPRDAGWLRLPASYSPQDAGWQRVPAVTNIGLRPTFAGQPDAPRIEAYLLNFDRDLYGQTITLEFLEFLRPEQRFPSVDALLAQIRADIERAKEIFAAVSPQS